jgi:hypothetical protein
MATSRELKALLRPLLVRRTDLAFAGRTLFFKPFTHYLRGVEFTTSRFNTASRAISFAHQLYNGQDSPDFGFSRGYKYRMADDWEEDLDQTSASLCDAMERNALPPVERIVDYIEHQRLPDYLGLLPGLKISDSPVSTFTLALGECSVGDFDSAEKRLSDIMRPSPLDSVIEVSRYSPYLRGRMAYLLGTLREDRNQVLPLLRDWEAYAVKGMKLTKYWKPTPFPCET